MGAVAEVQRRRAGFLYFLGAAVFWIVNTYSEAVYPGYSVNDQSLSRLGAVGSPTAILWDAAIFLFAACWLAAVVFAFRGAGRGWLVLNLVPGLTLLLVGLFPLGTVGVLHNIGSYGTFITAAIVAIIDARLVRAPFRWISVALGGFSLVLLVGALVLGAGPLGFGGAERLVAYPVVAWVLGFGAYLMAGDRELSPSP